MVLTYQGKLATETTITKGIKGDSSQYILYIYIYNINYSHRNNNNKEYKTVILYSVYIYNLLY